jgi:hypothetical protein
MAINPLQQPINYAVEVQSPFEAAIGGIKLGAGLEELNLARQKRAMEAQQLQAAQAQQAQFQSSLNSFFANPNRKFEDLEPILPMANKQQFDALQAIGKNMGERRLESAKLFSGQLLAALESNPTIARSMLEQRIQVETNPQQRDAFQATLNLLDVSPTQAAQMVEYTGMGAFGKDWYDNVIKLRNERDRVAKEPAARQAAVADAQKKLAEAADTPSRLAAEQVLRVAQTAREDALAAASRGAEARAATEAPARLAELEAKAIAAGVDAEFARPMAVAQLAKSKAEMLAPSVRESIDFSNLSPEQQKTFQSLQILKKPPAAVTNVNVSNVDKTAAAELGKLVPDLYNQANSAATQLSDLPRYQAALDSAITGPFAEQRLSVARIAGALGFTGEKSVNATREVIQGLSEMALKSRTMLTGQGQITEGEQKLLIKARSGDIDFTKGELKTIFGVADRAAKAQYNQSRRLLESAAKQSPTAQMFLENMQPLTTPEVAGAPASAAPQAAPSVPGMPAGFRVIQRGQ